MAQKRLDASMALFESKDFLDEMEKGVKTSLPGMIKSKSRSNLSIKSFYSQNSKGTMRTTNFGKSNSNMFNVGNRSNNTMMNDS